MNTQETPIPTLHESDIATLKQIAVFIAQEIAKKATATDEIYQCTAALEKELRRINQIIKANPPKANPPTSKIAWNEKWQPCPCCGGRDRFRLKLDSGTYICNFCTPEGNTIEKLLARIEAQAN